MENAVMRYPLIKIVCTCVIFTVLWIPGHLWLVDLLTQYPLTPFKRHLILVSGILSFIVLGVLFFLALRRNYHASQHAQLFHHHPIPMWIYDKQTLRFLSVNKATIARYGYTEGEFLSMTLKDIREPSEVEKLLKNVATNCDGDTSYRGTWLHQSKDGNCFHVEIYSHPCTYFGKTARIVTARDIDAQVKASKAAHEMSLRYELLANATHDAIFDWDMHSNTIHWNHGLSSLFGYGDKEQMQQIEWWRDKIHPEDKEHIIAICLRLASGEISYARDEYRFLCADGTYKYVLEKAYLICEQGIPARIIGIIQDIDQQVRQTQQISMLSLVASKTNNAILITSIHGDVEWINDGFTLQFGFTLEDIKKVHPLRLLLNQEDIATIQFIKDKIKEKVSFSAEVICHDKQGHPYWVNAAVTPVLNEQYGIERFVVIISDITEKKQFIQQLQEQNKALRDIAWINSHEIRRPVVSILSITQLLNEQHADPDMNRKLIDWLNKSTIQLDEIIHKIEHKVKDMQE